jgi:nitrate reductase / nitrite oxidoreductase, alpha subunit
MLLEHEGELVSQWAALCWVWGSIVPMTRAPDAHFYSEVRYRGAKSLVIASDFNEAAKFSDLWLHPKQGTDAALAWPSGMSRPWPSPEERIHL